MSQDLYQVRSRDLNFAATEAESLVAENFANCVQTRGMSLLTLMPAVSEIMTLCRDVVDSRVYSR